MCAFPAEAIAAVAERETECRHCGTALTDGPAADAGFCCRGCEAAFRLVHDLGLERYYVHRRIDPEARQLKPDEESSAPDLSAFILDEGEDRHTLHLMVEGLHCAACVWLIESVLGRQPGVTRARVNMTTRRLVLGWRGSREAANRLAGLITALGYRLVPYDPARLGSESSRRDRELMRAMAVAGFAAANVMLISVAVWAGPGHGMGPATRDLLHWFQALIALPAIIYAGRPFYRSAVAALRAGRANMDVPISLAVVLAGGMSLYETAVSGSHAYFDASVTLLFFLLVGRFLDSRARSRARSAAERLVSLAARSVMVIEASGAQRSLPPSRVQPGARALVAPGERIGIDGEVVEGISEVDTSLITGESVPTQIGPGDRVFAGTLNLTGPLRIVVSGAGEGTLLAEIVRLMEAAEHGRARYAAIADRVARAYVPAVHGLALGTFVGWLALGGAAWEAALLNAVAVLIVTCPCALALAVPVVQVVASGRLLRQGILVKSATALERMAAIDTVVLDKTGTLTQGQPELAEHDIDRDALRTAAALAGSSRHPLARALRRAVPDADTPDGVEEIPGAGLRLKTPRGEIRLGSRSWCRLTNDRADAVRAPGTVEANGPELWLARPDRAPIRFTFADRLRDDASDVVAALSGRGLRVEMLSGDRAEVAAGIAARVGIAHWRAGCTPTDKTAHLEASARAGHKVLMVGDGLNDAPALAAAHASMSPAGASDVSQTAADIVFQGERLGPVLEALSVARRSSTLVRQNFGLAFLYNAVTVPMAIAGLITPLIAAVAMSASSLMVTGNALRLAHGGRTWT